MGQAVSVQGAPAASSVEDLLGPTIGEPGPTGVGVDLAGGAPGSPPGVRPRSRGQKPRTRSALRAVWPAPLVANGGQGRTNGGRAKTPGPGRSRPGGECGASWNRTSDLTLVRADHGRRVCPGYRFGSEAAHQLVPRRSRDRTHAGACRPVQHGKHRPIAPVDSAQPHQSMAVRSDAARRGARGVVRPVRPQVGTCPSASRQPPHRNRCRWPSPTARWRPSASQWRPARRLTGHRAVIGAVRDPGGSGMLPRDSDGHAESCRSLRDHGPARAGVGSVLQIALWVAC